MDILSEEEEEEKKNRKKWTIKSKLLKHRRFGHFYYEDLTNLLQYPWCKKKKKKTTKCKDVKGSQPRSFIEKKKKQINKQL